ncbi:hypothetical protein [Flavobacterium sp.]|uniref:hypothetical protein n=1 Tax=Flavobacterium sp. TaxID=239 RepID=UPI0026028B66|nr:hypothetical protein [Flavobacterium sp.]
MKKLVSMMALAAFLVSMNTNAQEKPKEAAKKECSMKEKNSCSKDKKPGCCAAKKAEKKA